MELFHVGVVAEGVGPPAAYEVETCSRHRLQQIIAPVCRPSQLCSFLLCGLSVSGLVGGWDGDLGDGAKVGFALKDHVFVGCGWRVEGAVICCRGVDAWPPLRELCGLYGGIVRRWRGR